MISIDAGTTGVRSFAVDESGSPLGFAYREFTQHFPQPGWVEHDSEEIWQAVLGTLAELTASLDQPIAAIGITDQRETVVLWDKRTGVPRHRAIVWLSFLCLHRLLLLVLVLLVLLLVLHCRASRRCKTHLL